MLATEKTIFPLLLRRRVFLAAVFAAAFLVRFIYVLTLGEQLSFPDEENYIEIALNFLGGKGLVTDTGLVAARPPIYPLFLALIFKIFGKSLFAVRVVQALIGSLVPLATYYLARRVFGEWEAILSCVVTAFFNPFYVFYTGLLLTETPFILLIILNIFLLQYVFTARDWAQCIEGSILAGLGLALSALLRSSFLLFLPFAAPFWLIMAKKKKFALAAILITGAFLFIGVLPWGYRNKKLTGHYVFSTLTTGRSLYEACGPYADGGPAMHKTVWPEESRPETGKSEYDSDMVLKQKAKEYMQEHPGRTIKLALVKFKRFWNIVPNFAAYRKPFYIVASVLMYVPVLVLGLLGMWKCRTRLRRILFLLLPIIYFTLMHMVFVGSIRYREPIMSFMTILGAYFIANFRLPQKKWLHQGPRSS